GVVEHEHAVGDGEGDRSFGVPFADDDRDGGHRDIQHRGGAGSDRGPLAIELAIEAGVCARRVDERDDGELELFGELERTNRLAEAAGANPTLVLVSV